MAVHSAVGNTRLVETVEENSKLLDSAQLTGVEVILDADSDLTPEQRHAAIRAGLQTKGFALPDQPGIVTDGTPRLGAFVLPDNITKGTLEHVLLDCAQHVYPALLASATTHVDSAIVDTSLSPDDIRELQKPTGRNKAIIGSIASILRPGRAVQVSLQDNAGCETQLFRFLASEQSRISWQICSSCPEGKSVTERCAKPKIPQVFHRECSTHEPRLDAKQDSSEVPSWPQVSSRVESGPFMG